MLQHAFPEDFVPIAAELQRLPYLSPSRDFADRVISRIDRLQPAQAVAPVIASRHLELQQGGRQAVVPRRRMGVMRATGTAVTGVALLAAAAFMFFEVDLLTAILSAAVVQYSFVIAAVSAPHNRSTVSFGGRPRTTLGSLAAAFLWLVVLLLVGTFVLFFLGDYFKRAVEVVTNETGRSLLTGVLGGLASIPALIAIVIAMAITIIGIFFIPFGVAAFLIAVSGIAILGFLAVAQVAGIAIAGKREAETAAGQQLQFLYTGILAFSALWIIAAAFTWFPILGAILRMLAFSVTFVAVATGFGAVI